ncbi:hypothetical protein RJ639_046218 [Escallonia herrerae]|uniref:AT-hook motif nuclear-localized protein n=1 Tax=Escallonia herrerae TaxID=1293975 RepID=A0AA88W5Z2_9ASTE|nr:hypothetical protein RJ639_046218 [Escallonia herrerae]
MEEKESTESGSLGNHSVHSEADSLPVIGGATATAAAAAGGGGGVVAPQVVNTNLAVSSGGGNADSTGKKKRGRPRKYDADGNLTAPYLNKVASPPPGFYLTPSPDFSSKRGRGRPPGSGNWQLLASLGELFGNTAGGDFTPHVINVATGEDVAAKIFSLSHKGPRGICILAANGAVSNVTIRQPGSSGGILTYEARPYILLYFSFSPAGEAGAAASGDDGSLALGGRPRPCFGGADGSGLRLSFCPVLCFVLTFNFMQGRFEILSLSGSFTVSENGGIKCGSGGLSVSLAGPDGRVVGGGVAGLLLAASPIQIVVGSFMPNGYKTHKKKHQYEPRMAPANQAAPDVTAATPISQAAPVANTYPTPTSQVQVQSYGVPHNTASNKENPNSTSSDTAVWNGLAPTSDQRPSPDINMSAPEE